ncbi:MAG: hypothetical protein ACOH5I_17415 [Oligoflexus sp.]
MKKFLTSLAIVASSHAYSQEYLPIEYAPLFLSLDQSEVAGDLGSNIEAGIIKFEDISYKPLYQFEGDEEDCEFIKAELNSFICIEDAMIYLDESLLYSESHELKIGGKIGKALGKVTNPIKDNITKPALESINGWKGVQCGLYSAGAVAGVATGNGPGAIAATYLASEACMDDPYNRK